MHLGTRLPRAQLPCSLRTCQCGIRSSRHGGGTGACKSYFQTDGCEERSAPRRCWHQTSGNHQLALLDRAGGEQNGSTAALSPIKRPSSSQAPASFLVSQGARGPPLGPPGPPTAPLGTPKAPRRLLGPRQAPPGVSRGLHPASKSPPGLWEALSGHHEPTRNPWDFPGPPAAPGAANRPQAPPGAPGGPQRLPGAPGGPSGPPVAPRGLQAARRPT